jgi:hypothetical protein
MEQQQIVKQMIEFGHAAFNNAFNANTLFQDQFERVANTVLDQQKWIPTEGRKMIDSWTATIKTGRENFKKYVDESYKQAEDIFTS